MRRIASQRKTLKWYLFLISSLCNCIDILITSISLGLWYAFSASVIPILTSINDYSLEIKVMFSYLNELFYYLFIYIDLQDNK